MMQAQREFTVAIATLAISVLVGALALVGGCSRDDMEGSALAVVKVNAPAPNFTLKRHGASGQMSLSDLRGKVVMVNFWASWCPPCQSELPDIVSLYHDYRDQGFEVLGVLVNSNPEEVDRMINQFRIPYRSVTGNDGVARIWHVGAIPTTYMIDREGVIRAQYVGARSRATFERDIVRLLAD